MFLFWSVSFTIFLRLQAYEAIVAIFYQHASYVSVLNFVHDEMVIDALLCFVEINERSTA